MKLTDFFMELGKPVAYYPKLTAITGGVKETLFLCQLLYWEGKQQSKERWIYKTREELTEETGLSRYEQETARKNLKKLGFLEEKLAGIPATLHYRINLEAVNNAWNEYIENNKSSWGESTKQDYYEENNEDLNDDIPQTSLQKSNKLVSIKVTNKDAENQHTITENTTEITTKNTTEEYILSPSPISEDDINQLNEKEKDKDANRIEKIPYQKIVDMYNDICVSMPSVKAVTTKRKDKMKVLYREVKDLDVIEECFRKAENSSFLNGSSGKWSGCNFDWLLNYNNFIKVLEGTYDDKEVVKKRKEIDYEAAARNSKYGF